MTILTKALSWYQERPTWLKVILFVIPVFLFILIAFVLIFSGKGSAGETLVDALQKQSLKKEKTVLEKDKQLDLKLEEQKKRREENEKNREETYEKAKDIHNRIDNATSISELDEIDTSTIRRTN